MADVSPSTAPAPGTAQAVPLPEVRLELRHASGRPILYQVADTGFLVGSVPGCDLRLPGADLPPLLCLITPRPGGAALRKLAPTQSLPVNGRPFTGALLADGDRLTLGQAELLVHLRLPPETAGEAQGAEEQLEEIARLLDDRERRLAEQTRELEADRVLWYQRRQEIEQECARLQEQARQAAEGAESSRHQGTSAGEEQARQVAREKQEVEAVRQELASVRQQLYESYSQRRDRLAARQEAVDRAARKVQERKRQIDEEARQAALRDREMAARRAELDDCATQLERLRQELESRAREVAGQREEIGDQQRLLDSARGAWQQEVAAWTARQQDSERRLEQDRRVLTEQQAQYQADLVRLDRQREALEKRQSQLEEKAREVEARQQQLAGEDRDLQEQSQQLEEWHQKLCADDARIAAQLSEFEGRQLDLARRAAALEEQQVALAALRARLERTRDEQQREDQRLAEQRSYQEEMDADLRRRLQETQQLREKLEAGQRDAERDRQVLEERRTTLEAAAEDLRVLQESLDAENARLTQQSQEVEATTARQADEAAQLRQRSDQLVELQRRLSADRQVLREREADLVQGEQARAALQEQLRRRSEELAEKQRTLAEQGRRLAEETVSLETRRAEVDRQRQQASNDLDVLLRNLEGRRLELERSAADLERREDAWRQRVERLKASGRKLGVARKAHFQERSRWEARRQEEELEAARVRADLEDAREEALRLQRQLPELDQRARAAAEGLGRAREQLRQSLDELHAYARQSREDLEALRAEVSGDAGRLYQQGLALHRARDEHRLAVAAFRQQLIDWQAQVARMKSTLSLDETRLEQRQAQVEADSARLARQAEHLQVQERQVAQQRDEIDRHLSDMREWYRRKLRELSGASGKPGDTETAEGTAALNGSHPEGGEAPPVSLSPGLPVSVAVSPPPILSLTGDVDPADRQLGDLLRSLELIDADTLTALLVEARQQRRSLRQILLGSGCITLYQMALIEAGNLDGLVLGPVRVVDRVRVTPQEAVYRVFDPRGGPGAPAHAVLRHLAEAEMSDAVHPDEFRQRFAAAAAVRHPNVAATLEVLEVAGRPAVLQEWVHGLPSTEWTALAAVPGVWFRLLCQAALALRTAHQAGLAHGRLEPECLVLTGEGVLKVLGFGEPGWLRGTAPEAPADDLAGDLAALGRIALAWASAAPRRKGGKPKPLPEPVQEVLDRLGPDAKEGRYESADLLLSDLERIGADVSANTEAWERLLRHVREQAAEDTALRESA